MRPGAGAAVPETTINTLNVRGELVDSVGGRQTHRRTTTNSGCSSTSTIPDDLSQYDASNDSTVSPGTCDRVNGISIAADSSIQSTLYDGQSYPTGTTNSETFDGTGRIVQTVHTAYGFAQRNGSQAHVPAHGSGDPGAADAGAATAGGPTDTVSSFTKTTSVRAYDVENHFRTVQTTLRSTGPSKTNVTTTGPATTIGWGPNGHPANIAVNYPGGTTTNETLHWDGDTILFVTDGAGNVTDFKVGLDGDVTPRDGTFSGLSVYDRDPAGVIVQTSNATGSTGFNPLDPSTVSGAGAAGTTGYRAANVPEQYVRGDGFMVAGVQINGVRAFDPNLGAWTTPDAYAGDVHDPVSQQRYMWNRGNAFQYSDPSGYDVVIYVPGMTITRVPGVSAGQIVGAAGAAVKDFVGRTVDIVVHPNMGDGSVHDVSVAGAKSGAIVGSTIGRTAGGAAGSAAGIPGAAVGSVGGAAVGAGYGAAIGAGVGFVAGGISDQYKRIEKKLIENAQRTASEMHH
jgi:hypothetical protein